MSGAPSPQVLDAHRRRIEEFVHRARRVEAHSLLADRRQFQRWAEGATEIGSVDGVVSATQEVPPEEAFESLATRCRPFLLTGDPVYWPSVSKSLRAFLKHDVVFWPNTEALRVSWGTAVSPSLGTGFAFSMPGQVAADAVGFAKLAESWLYGDVVHADTDAHTRAAGHTLNRRYAAAVVRYGQVAIHVIATLELIRRAQTTGKLGLEETAFETQVKAKVPMRFPLARLVIAEVGTPAQTLYDLLDQAQVEQRQASSQNTGKEDK